jgi:hypothetical protein
MKKFGAFSQPLFKRNFGKGKCLAPLSHCFLSLFPSFWRLSHVILLVVSAIKLNAVPDEGSMASVTLYLRLLVKSKTIPVTDLGVL